MTILVSKPWKSAPYGPVSFSRSSTLSVGLEHLYYQNLNHRINVRRTLNTGITSVANYLTTTGSAGTFIGPVGNAAGISDAWTQFCIVRPTTVSARRSPALIYLGDGRNSFGFGMGYSTPSAVFMYGTATGNCYTTEAFSGFWVANTWIAAGASYDFNASAKAAFYKNGVNQGAVTVNGAEGVATLSGDLIIGDSLASNLAPWIGNVMLWAMWSRKLSDAEHASLAANPWQLFAPRQIIIPALVVATAAPTLSSLSAINVTASSAQPRITYTF